MQSTLTQKDADLCLKPQGLLATRIFALGYTYVRIGSHVRTRKPIHIYGYPMVWLSFLHDIM